MLGCTSTELSLIFFLIRAGFSDLLRAAALTGVFFFEGRAFLKIALRSDLGATAAFLERTFLANFFAKVFFVDAVFFAAAFIIGGFFFAADFFCAINFLQN